VLGLAVLGLAALGPRASARERGAEPASVQGWALPCIDCPQNRIWMGDQALRLDSQGLPHLAYGGDEVYYARFDGSAWQVEAVAGRTFWVGNWYQAAPALALDGQDAPHLVYLDGSGFRLMYAVWAGGGWQHEEIDSILGGHLNRTDTAVSIGPEGEPRVAYQKQGALMYAVRSAGAWLIETVDDTEYTEVAVTLALDGSGEPRIGYWSVHDGDQCEMRYAARAGGAWSVEVVDAATYCLGEWCSIGVAPDGTPHLTYRDARDSLVKHAVRSEAGWQVEAVGASPWWYGATSTVVDGEGVAHISYAAPGGARYAVRGDDGWAIELYDPHIVTHTSLAFDRQGQPRIAEWDYTDLAVTYWARRDGAWSAERVDGVTQVGRHASLAVDGLSNPHVAYTEYNRTGELRYAHATGPAWSTEVVDQIGRSGGYADIVVDAAGSVHVSYYANVQEGMGYAGAEDGHEGLGYDEGGGELRYARWEPGAWITETVDAAGDTGPYSSIALDEAGRPQIAYYSAKDGVLRYAAWSGTDWITETVDAGGDAGRHASLALDAGGTAHIAYYGGEGGDLRHAWGGPGAWITETVDAAGDTGLYASLALDGSGIPRIAYYDATAGDLRYARWSGTAWQRETVDAEGDTGLYASLALDTAGNPRIAYYDAGQGSLRLATWDGSAWQKATVDDTDDRGAFASLALDGAGRVHIAYHDRSYGTLRFAEELWPVVYVPMVVGVR